MATLYITEPGSKLRSKSGRLVAEKDGNVLLSALVSNIDQVVCMGPVQVTTQALYLCMRHGIELAFTTMTGRIICQLTPPAPRNLELRLLQYDTFRNDAYRLASARNIVACKAHQYAGILRDRLKQEPVPALAEARESMQQIVPAVASAADLDVLRGIEGALARMWYGALGYMLIDPLGYHGRSRRPPKDPVNALLSLGFSLATTRLNGMIDGAGLDPHLGLMHAAQYGRPALALDLVEEFRAELVARFVISVLNHGWLKAGDFEERDGGVYLEKSKFKHFLKLWERHLNREYVLPWPASNYDEAFRAAVKQVRQCLERQLPYRPCPLEVKIR